MSHKIRYLVWGAVGISCLWLWYVVSQEPTKVEVSSFLQKSAFLEKLVEKENSIFSTHAYSLSYVPEMNAYFYIDKGTTDSIKKQLAQGIYWEGTIGNLIKQHCQYGSIVIDIGAHIGIHSIAMSRKVGPTGTVLSFEPQKKIYAELVHNLYENNCTNVVAFRKALGDAPGTVQMDPINPSNEGGCAIGSGGDTAEMITLDSLHLTGISLIKVDVERYELFVFKGMKETILRNKPVLIFEVMGECNYEEATPEVRKSFTDVLEYVTSLGYSVQQIFGNDYIAMPLEPLPLTCHEQTQRWIAKVRD